MGKLPNNGSNNRVGVKDGSGLVFREKGFLQCLLCCCIQLGKRVQIAVAEQVNAMGDRRRFGVKATVNGGT